MLRLIPPRGRRLLFRAAHRLRTTYWRIFKPTVHGCSVVARNADGDVLLVRPSYGLRAWQFPGGGVAKGEDPKDAACREFTEETGCALADLRLIGIIEERLYGATNVVHVFAGSAQGTPRVDRAEIVAAAFHPAHELPRPISTTVARRLALLEQV